MASLTRNTAITFLTRMAVVLLEMSVSVFLARILGPAELGTYALIFVIVNMAVKLGSFGLEVSNAYFPGQRPIDTKKLAGNSLIFSMSAGTVVLVLFSFFVKTDFFQSFAVKNDMPLSLLWTAMGAVPFYLLYLLISTLFLGQERIKTFNTLSLMRVGLKLAAIAIFLLIFKNKLFGSVAGTVASVCVFAFIVLYIENRVMGIEIHGGLDIFQKSIRYGLKSYLGTLAQFLNYRMDLFLVAFFLTPVEVGFYVVAVRIAEKIWMLPESIATVLLPRVSSSQRQKVPVSTVKIVRKTIILVLSLCIFLAFFSKFLILKLFGPEYAPSILPFLMLLPGVAALSWAKVMSADLAGKGKPQIAAFSTLISLGVNIPLNIILIPRIGITGAALASSAAYIVSGLMLGFMFARISGINFVELFRFRKGDFLEYKSLLQNLLRGKVHDPEAGL